MTTTTTIASSINAAAEKARYDSARKQIFDIPMTYQLERRVNEMSNLGEGVWQRGIAEGEKRTLVSSIKNLMDSLHFTMEQAMDALKISDSDREKYRSLILMEK